LRGPRKVTNLSPSELANPLPSPSTRPGPAPPDPDDEERGARWKPKAQLRALFPQRGEQAPVSDWASLFGDLSRSPTTADAGEAVEWRIHDKTHLEFAIDYPLGKDGRKRVWEAYFFVPESFRIHEATYSKKAIYEDLQSYVRYAVPEPPFEELGKMSEGSFLHRVDTALGRAAGAGDKSTEVRDATRELRLWVCLVRACGLVAMRSVEQQLKGPIEPERIRRDSLGFAISCNEVSRRFHAVVDRHRASNLPDEVRFALDWCDEASSIAVETLCADLALRLENDARVEAAHPDLAEHVAAAAVAEARHREEKGFDSVGRAGANERDIEHLEFRRHVLKRFTASVLWLSLEVREGALWTVHVLYAIAAMLAMGFAVVAALKTSHLSDNVFRYALLVVLAYAIKDRMKAVLQEVFNKWISKRFPDRLWAIKDHERNEKLGWVRERAGFVPFNQVPEGVLAKRRLTREHSLEECARPERVLWHTKEVEIEAGKDTTFPMLTEIFRLNVDHWLAHTDDPKRRVLFADPGDESIYAAIARRVYNVSVVYRMRGENEPDAAWHRIRVVVSRKGILRIEPIC
jgi:hypothetical protein